MKKMLRLRFFAVVIMAISIPVLSGAQALKTPLSQEILTMLTNEISGQIAYNNIIKLAGAPWVRDIDEFTDTFYESKTIHEIAKSYGVENSVLERYAANGNFEYPFEGEFWVDGTLTARLSADAALIARSSQTADISGELIYVAPFNADQAEKMITKGTDPKYNGKIALMWSHPRGNAAAALDAAGLFGVISFSTHDRYLDPNQVIYSRGSYGNLLNLKLGFSVSWRQWSELLEDVEKGIKHNVHCKADVQYFPNKFETVFSWIPGTEPDKKGVIFTAHLFEGYIKRGTNDNMSGCVVQLEILRALNKLIKSGELPQPRRTIYFV